MNVLNWDGFRDADGYIELVDCFLYLHPHCENSGPAEKYLESIMEIAPIRSRQAAAIALATAARLTSDWGGA